MFNSKVAVEVTGSDFKFTMQRNVSAVKTLHDGNEEVERLQIYHGRRN